jgi:hypothetical protein
MVSRPSRSDSQDGNVPLAAVHRVKGFIHSDRWPHQSIFPIKAR